MKMLLYIQDNPVRITTKNDAMKTMTPFEPTTDGQIGKLNEKLTARIKKHSKEFPSDVFQQLLSDDSLIDEMFTSIRKRIEARGEFITRTIHVNRTLSAKEALKATGRKQYVNDGVVKTMPQGKGAEVEIVLFKIGRQVSCAELDKEYELRGLNPADTYSLCAFNEANPSFADEHPHGTQWKDKDGKYCFATFSRFYDERNLNVNQNYIDWFDCWWFAGLRK